MLLYNKWLDKSSVYEIPSHNHISTKLNMGELNFPVHPEVASILSSCYTNTNCCRYNTKDQAYADLRTRISYYVSVPPTHIMLTHGSDNALRIVCDIFCTPDTIILMPYPTYPHFEQMLSTHPIKELRKVPMDYFLTDDEISNVIRKNISQDVSVLYLVRPDLSIGFNISVEFIEEMVSHFSNTLFIIDEAYIEFADNTDSCTILTKQYNNIVVVRTFSKFFSLAALRIGYMVSCPSLIQLALPLNNTKDVSRIAVRSAILSLKHLDFYLQTKNELYSIKNWLKIQLDELQQGGHISGWLIRDSMYFLIFSPHAKTLCDLLKTDFNILVRDKSDVLHDAIRITLSNRDDMNLLVSALKVCTKGLSNHKSENIHH